MQQVIDEIKERKEGPAKKPSRLMVWGSIVDDINLYSMIEELDANIVMDDTCMGSRNFFPDVKIDGDQLDNLAYRYLMELRCPRTFMEILPRPIKKDYMSDLKNRFGYLEEYAKEWQVDGVILQSLRYCDTHGYEVPALRDYFNSIGLPSIYLEHDYTVPSLAQLRTRVQTFLEIISQG